MTDKEIMIICPNSNLKNYILKLQHERDKLRKYLIDICKLLGIDTRQSLLGANCLEFYTVLSSTAENRIKELKEWQEANQPTGICETCTAKSVEDMYKYKQALNEIEKIVNTDYYQDSWGTLAIKVNNIKGIINKVKEKTINEKS